jgi:hypothetical protein
MKQLKKQIKNTFNLSTNQVNLIILSTMTSLFQGAVYYIIDKDRFSIKYFSFTVVMCFIYYIFYYKTYIGDKKGDVTRSSTSSKKL